VTGHRVNLQADVGRLNRRADGLSLDRVGLDLHAVLVRFEARRVGERFRHGFGRVHPRARSGQPSGGADVVLVVVG